MEEIAVLICRIITSICCFVIMIILIIISDRVYKPKRHHHNNNNSSSKKNGKMQRNLNPSPVPQPPQPSQSSDCVNCKPCGSDSTTCGIWTAGPTFGDCNTCCQYDVDTGKKMSLFQYNNNSACIADDGNECLYASEICGNNRDCFKAFYNIYGKCQQ